MNSTNQRFEDRPWRRLAVLEKAMQDIKTAQPLGASSLEVLSSDIGAASVTINAGQAQTFATTFTPPTHKLQKVEFVVSFFIDHDLDLNYVFRSGALLTGDQLMLRRNDWMDWAQSNDTTGVRVYKTLIDNYLGTLPHTVYYYSRAYYFKGGF